jgi:Fe-S-cluster containining protein
MNKLPEPLNDMLQRSSEEQKEIHAFLKRSKKNRNLDELFHKAHDEVFQKVDCLTCGNCCKTTSPIFRDADIRRIAKHLKIKGSELIEKYLYMDDDRDYVLKKAPCVFLLPDNRCEIYENRPLACREYPHTNRKNMYQLINITERNTRICPAVAEIVLKIKG